MLTLTNNAIQILKDRYLLKDEEGKNIETPEQLFKRVAKHIASAEKEDRKHWEQDFYQLMVNKEFLPNSPTLMNAGLPQGQLSACFVLPVEDSLQSIFSTLTNAALIHQSGGGTGYNFSKLRPRDDFISTSGGTSSGPIAFMKVYDAATEHVKQGGKRRGANMGILNIDHPDIEAFITAKSDGLSLQNFNISIGITDDFMRAVAKDAQWDLVNPRTNNIQKTVKATALWQMIADQAWKTGDPGLIFLDTINADNPTPQLEKIQSTNPCGEVPLLDNESCNLGSLNLMSVLSRDKKEPKINWTKLEGNITTAVRFLDNVITVNHYLLPELKAMATSNRKIGLGVMGWAELLMSLGIPYASDKAISLAGQLMKFIQEKSYEASKGLALEKGAYSKTSPLRNATCNSIAPTGTISVIADTSYSIEPLFALAYKRVGILDGKTQTTLNPVFVGKMKELGLWNSSVEKEVYATGSIQHTKNIPTAIKKLFKTSLEIPWQYHLLHQKAFQEHTDNAVSKTINLPETATVKEVADSYWKAWEHKLKGITIYRYGSKENQVLQRCGLDDSGDC